MDVSADAGGGGGGGQRAAAQTQPRAGDAGAAAPGLLLPTLKLPGDGPGQLTVRQVLARLLDQADQVVTHVADVFLVRTRHDRLRSSSSSSGPGDGA
jgi:hypothetical protein